MFTGVAHISDEAVPPTGKPLVIGEESAKSWGGTERAKFLAAGNETKAGAAETKAIPAMYEHETK
jgi:hypothetical protein